MAKKPPAEGVFGWLGRQVGHVKKAVKTKPGPAPQRPPAAPPPAQQQPPPSPAVGAGSPPSVIYREGRVEEADHPTQPGVKLRRTIIDEIVVNPPAPPAPPAAGPTDRD